MDGGTESEFVVGMQRDTRIIEGEDEAEMRWAAQLLARTREEFGGR